MMKVSPRIQIVISVICFCGFCALIYLNSIGVIKELKKNGKVIQGKIIGVSQYYKTRSSVIIEFEYKSKKYCITKPTYCFKPKDSVQINNLTVEVFCDTINPNKSVGLLSRNDYDQFKLYYSKYVNAIEKLKKCN
ncbi:MAG TPA: hypothetical protein VK175_08290 [Leadbetterella sp.]|nr:hypothetical protein [Leadbetterella sp.]